jgi:hypothetical protein
MPLINSAKSIFRSINLIDRIIPQLKNPKSLTKRTLRVLRYG